MDYKGIEAEVEKHRETLEIIDKEALMWHFSVRRLRSAKESGNQRTYHTYLEDMQTSLCLASIIETLQAQGYSISGASHDERMENMIAKGKTSEGKDYHLSLEMEPGYGEFIVTVINGEETGRYPIFEYRKELFAKQRELADVLSGFLRRRT